MNGHIAPGDNDSASSSELRSGTAAPKSLARQALEVALARSDEFRSLVRLFRASIMVLKDSLKASHET